jgi:hypothetical protein
MTTNATAPQSPARWSAGPMCCDRRSLWINASLAAVVANRTAHATRPDATATDAARRCVVSVSARPAANPAGTQAAIIRASGCAPLPASSSSGSAPRRCGPAASAPPSRSRYSQPTPPPIASRASSQPADAPTARSAG